MLTSRSTYGYGSSDGRLASVTHDGVAMSYGYVSHSDLISSVTSGSNKLVVSKSYDPLNRLTSISSDASGASMPVSFDYRYNQANQRTAIVEEDGKFSDMTYDPYGQLTDVTRRWSNGDLLAGQQFRYSYDALGNRETTGGRVSAESTYITDRLNQIDWQTIADELDIIGIANPTASVTVNSNTADQQG